MRGPKPRGRGTQMIERQRDITPCGGTPRSEDRRRAGFRTGTLRSRAPCGRERQLRGAKKAGERGGAHRRLGFRSGSGQIEWPLWLFLPASRRNAESHFELESPLQARTSISIKPACQRTRTGACLFGHLCSRADVGDGLPQAPRPFAKLPTHSCPRQTSVIHRGNAEHTSQTGNLSNGKL